MANESVLIIVFKKESFEFLTKDLDKIGAVY